MNIKLDKSIYSKDVLLKTAYAFTDRVYLHLSQDAENWIINWINKDDGSVSERDFENEMIEQQLREGLLQKSSDIRKLILARAYASTLIDEPENYKKSDSCDANTEDEDGSDILKGWFDQYD